MTSPFAQLLEDRDVVLLDGATGTELQRRGFATPLPLWTADAAVRGPDLLRRVHLEYLQAGADIVTANTFRTAPYTLRAAGREADAAAWTRRSVELAREACAVAGRGLVAGSMAPLEDCYRPDRVPAAEVLQREHAAHAHNLAAAGVDLILVETMNTLREARAAAATALRTGLPVLVSLVLHPDHGELLSGEDLDAAWAELRGLEVGGARLAGFLVNCAPPFVVAAALERMEWPHETRPSGAYANLGTLDARGGWTHDDDTPADLYGEWGLECADLGARILGGCCGTTPAHIRALAEALREAP
jgi:S-methylmethionine-dependent homocysteine/selenocysteine methylase